MSSQKHTPEPWQQGLTKHYIVNGESNLHIAVCHYENEANAARIVACVNAMRGIENPQSFIETVKHLKLDAYETAKQRADAFEQECKSLTKKHGAAMKEISELVHQRDELLAALEAITEGTAFDKETGLIWGHWHAEFVELIAKVRGGQS